jgi:hypothetical protein
MTILPFPPCFNAVQDAAPRTMLARSLRIFMAWLLL